MGDLDLPRISPRLQETGFKILERPPLPRPPPVDSGRVWLVLQRGDIGLYPAKLGKLFRLQLKDAKIAEGIYYRGTVGEHEGVLRWFCVGPFDWALRWILRGSAPPRRIDSGAATHFSEFCCNRSTRLVAAFVALFVGLLGSVGTWRQVNVARIAAEAAKTSADASMMSAQYAGTRALANVRIDWLETLRDTLSEYHSILMSWHDDEPAADDEAKAKIKEQQDVDYRKLSFLGTKLDLLLNQEKKYQKDLWQVSDDIMKLEKPTEADLDQADKKLVVAARIVLDFHWRKIKAEILGNPPLKEPLAERRTKSATIQPGD
jgi:hypothetical protein